MAAIPCCWDIPVCTWNLNRLVSTFVRVTELILFSKQNQLINANEPSKHAICLKPADAARIRPILVLS